MITLIIAAAISVMLLAGREEPACQLQEWTGSDLR